EQRVKAVDAVEEAASTPGLGSRWSAWPASGWRQADTADAVAQIAPEAVEIRCTRPDAGHANHGHRLFEPGRGGLRLGGGDRWGSRRSSGGGGGRLQSGSVLRREMCRQGGRCGVVEQGG